MKKGKKYIWLLLILLLVMCLSGCGKRQLMVRTELTLLEDGSGSRQMVIEIRKSDFENVFSGVNTEEFNSCISDGCPSQLTMVREEEEGVFRYLITMQFSSMEEYQKMASEVIGKEVEISFFQPESVFADGIRYEENFTSVDMLGWLKELLVTNGYLDEETASDLFADGETALTYGDRNYKSDGKPIVIDDMTVTPVERIDILTNYMQNKSCSRQIIFTFSRESMNQNGDAIQSYLLKKTPESAVGEWSESGDRQMYSITAPVMSAAALNEFMTTLFYDTETFVSEKPLQKTGIFTASCEWSEVIDASAFTYDNSETVALGYYVQWEDGMELAVRRQNAQDNLKLEESDRYGGYKTVLEKEIGKESLVTSISANYIVDRIEVNTVFDSADIITREIALCFQMNPDQEDLERIRRNILQRASGYADVNIGEKREDQKTSIQIVQKGNMDDINEGYLQIFGVQGQMSHETDGDLMAIRHDGHLVDLMDFTKFIENDAQKTILVYHLELPYRERIIEDSVSSTVDSREGTQKSSGNTYDAEIQGAYLSLTLGSKVWNSDGLKLLLIIVAFVVFVVLVIVMADVIRRMLERMKNGVEGFNSSFGGNDQQMEKFPDETKERKGGILKKLLGLLIILRTPKAVLYEEEQYIDDNLDEDSYFGDIEEKNYEEKSAESPDHTEYDTYDFEQDEIPENMDDFGLDEMPESMDDFGQDEIPESMDNFGQDEMSENMDDFGLNEMPENMDDLRQDEMSEAMNDFELDEMPESEENFGMDGELKPHKDFDPEQLRKDYEVYKIDEFDDDF